MPAPEDSAVPLLVRKGAAWSWRLLMMFGVVLVGTGSAGVVWLALATLCGLVGITTARRRRERCARYIGLARR